MEQAQLHAMIDKEVKKEFNKILHKKGLKLNFVVEQLIKEWVSENDK